MTDERLLHRRVHKRDVDLAAEAADPASAALSEASRRAAELARIAASALQHCTSDVDVEAELEARRNASGQ
jgi:hypothetical protein